MANEEPVDPNNLQRPEVLRREEARCREREFVRLRVQSILREAALLTQIPYSDVTVEEFTTWAKDEFLGARYDLEVGTAREVARRRENIEGKNPQQEGDRS